MSIKLWRDESDSHPFGKGLISAQNIIPGRSRIKSSSTWDVFPQERRRNLHIGAIFWKLFGSVDILVATMRIRNPVSVGIIICCVGRRGDGRSRTPAFCPHRHASLPGGDFALPKPIQQTPIHAAALEPLREFAGGRPSGFRANAYQTGAADAEFDSERNHT
jgi:hypothetical protein